MSKLGPWRVAPRCIVCNYPVVVQKGTMCGVCKEAYDRFNRRDSTTLGLIRWAAQRARKYVNAPYRQLPGRRRSPREA